MSDEGEMSIEHKPIKSSSVASIGYDPSEKVLEVKYLGSGKTYAYHGVAYDQHLKLMTAKSVGNFVQNVLQKNHKATLVR